MFCDGLVGMWRNIWHVGRVVILAMEQPSTPAQPIIPTSTHNPANNYLCVFLRAGAPTQYSGYATCSDALADIPGYTYVIKMLSNCPDLNAMHSDPTQQKTFFVPSNAVGGIAVVCMMV